MSSKLLVEDVFIQIKDKLQKDSIKLWLPPYYNVEKCSPMTEELMILAKEYSHSLNLPYESCFAALSELQSNALEKLKQRDRFKQSGVAGIKVKILHQNNSRLISKEISLNSSGFDLKKSVATDANTTYEKIKLIGSGKVINDADSLMAQGVKNGQQILALVLLETPTESMDVSETFKELENVKADTKLLAADDNNYMQLEDQAGNVVKIPSRERKSLMVAMALHEKGRSALKKGDYARALIFFLDADKEYRNCNSQLLNSVDNYALLDLDIAWCYLCLQSVQHLPEAYERLVRCEDRFHKSYGPNLERLIALKGTPGNEAALLMRLHLLQAIVLYHQNKREASLRLLRKAQAELSELKVDENNLMALVELGFSVAEARLGLRATRGDVNSAAIYINENREKRAQSRKKAAAERILQREKKKLGICADGKQYVEPSFVQMLINMGYNKETARIALQKMNNVISDSVQYIQEHPQAGPSGTKSEEMLSLMNDLIPELEAAGFNPHMAKLALKKHKGDIMKAAEDLLENDGIIDDEWSDDDSDSFKDDKNKKKEEAFQRLAQDISMVDDDHLDLTLQEEEEFLNQYLSLLQKLE